MTTNYYSERNERLYREAVDRARNRFKGMGPVALSSALTELLRATSGKTPTHDDVAMVDVLQKLIAKKLT